MLAKHTSGLKVLNGVLSALVSCGIQRRQDTLRDLQATGVPGQAMGTASPPCDLYPAGC